MRKDSEDVSFKEATKDMTFPQKLEHFWTYYKWVLVLIIIAIVIIYTGISWYQSSKVKTLLTAAPVNSFDVDTVAAQQSMQETLGLDGKYEVCEVLPTISADEKTGLFDMYSQVSYLTRFQTGMLDIMMVPESVRDYLGEEGTFADLTELFTSEELAAYEGRIEMNCLPLEDESLKKMFGLEYEPVYIGVIVNSQHKETAAEWIRQVMFTK